MSTAHDKLNADIRKACTNYRQYLDSQSPIVSDSHYVLNSLYQTYGKSLVDAELDRQFAALKKPS